MATTIFFLVSLHVTAWAVKDSWLTGHCNPSAPFLVRGSLLEGLCEVCHVSWHWMDYLSDLEKYAQHV